MTAKTKTVNYTDEMVTEMRETYDPSASVEDRNAAVDALVASLNKPRKSVVAKLVAMKVYVKPEPVGKRGGVKKSALVDSIAKAVPMAENDAESLTKATMNALKAVLAAVTASVTINASESGEFADSE